MRGRFIKALKWIALLFLLFLFLRAGRNLSEIRKLERLGVYDMKTALTMENAESILEQAALAQEEKQPGTPQKSVGIEEDAAEYPHDVLFFNEKKKQVIENPAWYRRTETTVVEICGDSTLLFPFGYPLEAKDNKGCLLGEESARELFGGIGVIGEEVIYEGKTYEIRGILTGKNILVIEGGKNASFSYVGIFGDTPLQKDKRIVELENLGGIFLTEVPLRFYGTIVKIELFFVSAFLYGLTGFMICKSFREKKRLGKAFILAAVPLGLAGIFFVLSITAYRMPDKVSDLSWWEAYFREEGKAWGDFFEREEIFLQEDYKAYILFGN